MLLLRMLNLRTLLQVIRGRTAVHDPAAIGEEKRVNTESKHRCVMGSIVAGTAQEGVWADTLQPRLYFLHPRIRLKIGCR